MPPRPGVGLDVRVDPIMDDKTLKSMTSILLHIDQCSLVWLIKTYQVPVTAFSLVFFVDVHSEAQLHGPMPGRGIALNTYT